MIRLYDMNNHFRKSLETDLTGRAPRTFMDEMFACPDVAICVWDGLKGSQRRRDIFPGYKVGRTPPPQGVYNTFKFTQEILAHTKAMQCIVPSYEADDVIAVFARRYADQGHDVGVYSTDQDFNQLHAETHKGRIFLGLNPKSVEGIGHARFTRLYKTLVGDPSDKIPGIPGFGPKSWANEDKDELLKQFTKWMATGKVDLADFFRLNLSKSVQTYIQASLPTLKIYWDIVGFFDVEMDLINEHTTFGKPDWAAADAKLREFLL